jgi:SAM-dependent methyltransferase
MVPRPGLTCTRGTWRGGVWGCILSRSVTSFAPLLPAFNAISRATARLLEVGYGPGALGISLSRSGYSVLGIDPDPEVIDLARTVNERLAGLEDFQICDLFEIDRIFGDDSFDAVISDVTLEHFIDDDIVDALQKQLIVAPLNIFAIHCANILPEFRPGLDGGERLLSPSYWKGLIKRAGGQVIHRFGYGFAYTRLGTWNWRVPIIAETILYQKLAGLGAATGCVVRRRE